MPEQPRDRPLDDLETALKALKPSAQLQRDQLMFQAGQASAKRRRWMWPATTAAFAALAAGLVGVLVFRPEPMPEVRVVYVTVQPAPTPMVQEQPKPETPRSARVETKVASTNALQDGAGLWQMRQQALRWGIESVPLPPPSSSARSEGQPLTVESLLDELAKNRFGKIHHH